MRSIILFKLRGLSLDKELLSKSGSFSSLSSGISSKELKMAVTPLTPVIRIDDDRIYGCLN
jgi:hypothetical protein